MMSVMREVVNAIVPTRTAESAVSADTPGHRQQQRRRRLV